MLGMCQFFEFIQQDKTYLDLTFFRSNDGYFTSRRNGFYFSRICCIIKRLKADLISFVESKKFIIEGKSYNRQGSVSSTLQFSFRTQLTKKTGKGIFGHNRRNAINSLMNKFVFLHQNAVIQRILVVDGFCIKN